MIGADELARHAAALAQVLLIDVTLAGDNAVVVGLAVAGLEPGLRRRAIAIGVVAATAIRLGLALVAVRLIRIIGLTLAGGLLLLWVAWRMARELRENAHPTAAGARPGGMRAAIVRIVLADLSMSLDNVLAVAGAAGRDTVALVVGLAFSVILMAVAANAMAGLLARRPWIAWAGLALVLYVALHMIWQGGHLVLAHLQGPS